MSGLSCFITLIGQNLKFQTNIHIHLMLLRRENYESLLKPNEMKEKEIKGTITHSKSLIRRFNRHNNAFERRNNAVM